MQTSSLLSESHIQYTKAVGRIHDRILSAYTLEIKPVREAEDMADEGYVLYDKDEGEAKKWEQEWIEAWVLSYLAGETWRGRSIKVRYDTSSFQGVLKNFRGIDMVQVFPRTCVFSCAPRVRLPFLGSS